MVPPFPSRSPRKASRHRTAPPTAGPRVIRGFSLVEISLALGVVSFALVGILGLLPVALSTFRRAIDSTVSAQIADRIANEAAQTGFDQLADRAYYFDDQGGSVQAAAAGRVYTANLTVIRPSVLPGVGNGTTDLATLTVRVRSLGGDSVWTSSTHVARTAR